jgi:cysteine-rich repeat protein
VDNNGNGLVDCDDSDCASDPACFEFECNDYLDDDGDGQTDCLDPDCNGLPQCQELCSDGIDNDGDTLVDCFDVACRGSALCPQQRCAGLGTYAFIAGNGVFYQGFGTPMTGCGPGEGCSLISPPTEFAVAGALVPTYEGVCAPRLADGESCTAEPADGYCEGSVYGGAGCIGGLCRRESIGCDAGQEVGYRIDFLGGYRGYCVPAALAVATGQPCGDLSGTLCGRFDDRCVSRDDLRETDEEGICARSVSSPEQCPAGTRFERESITAGQRAGLCLSVVGEGAACGVAQRCDETLGLVCGAGGTCRAAVQAEACDSPSPLTANTSAVGPDFFAVDRLDGLTAADESLNCSGTVGPEKVYFYTATATALLRVEAGSIDGNGPPISWYARRSTCGDIFAETSCGSASVQGSSGTLQVSAGETIYIIVDSEARWAGGDGEAAEFFVAVTEKPIAEAGESCAAAVCTAGLNCTLAKVCATPSCGDGQIDAGEQCDDGNSAAGDGCEACTLESYTEVEPNNASTSANFVGAARRVYGSATFESDYFCVPVGPLGGKVSFRPVRVDGVCDLLAFGDLGYPSCEGEPTMVAVDGSEYCFYVYSSAGDYAFDLVAYPYEELAEHEACGIARVTGAACGDIGGNAAVCRETDPRLHTGTCEVTSCGDGYLDKAAGEACDDGNLMASDGCSGVCALEDYAEQEPNNGTITARNIAGYRQVSGTISGPTDFDYFKVTLARRSHLEFDAEAPDFPIYSDGLGIQLLSPTAAVLFAGAIDNASSRSGARGGTELNGTGFGTVYREQGLAFLEPGTYTFRVSAASTYTGAYTLFIREFATSVVGAGGACQPSDYKPCLDGLVCSVLSETCETPVCGNGDVTVGEQCDDGNTTAGDGCNATCRVEAYSAASIPADTAPSAAITGGVVYPFAGGSQVRAIAISGPWEPGSNRYVTVRLDAPTRIRALNVTAPYTRNRVWKLDAPSTYSTAGTQVIGIQPSSTAYPSWFSALTPALASDVDCGDRPVDGVCTSPGTGTDCADCGARYGSTPQTAYGFDTQLAPGNYLIEISNDDSAAPSWLFLGESPSERRTFR